MFYTDGLVERPRVSLRATIDELAGAVDQAQTAEEACLLAVDRMVPVRGPRDDVAVIACRNEVIPPRLELTFAADPAMLTHVRHMLGRWLRKHEVARDVAGEITIAVSEACANAVEHAYGPGDGRFSVGADFAGDSVSVTIRDAGQWRPARGEHRGRGLTIMEAAMDAVEVASGDRGTVVSMRRRVNAGAAG
jgi:anti-sigma regulatory factor (Ser/Thr protein kinase)